MATTWQIYKRCQAVFLLVEEKTQQIYSAQFEGLGRNVNGHFGGQGHLWSGKIMVAFLRPKREWAFWRTLAFVVRESMVAFLTFLPPPRSGAGRWG